MPTTANNESRSGTGILAKVAVVLVCALAVVHLGFRVQLLGNNSTDIGGAEMNVVYGIQKIMLGSPIYTDPEQLPFDVVQYTPLYHFMGAGLAGIVGIGAKDVLQLFLMNRILGLVLNLLLVLIVYRIGGALKVDRYLSVIAAALLFGSLTEHYYGRPDALQALLSLAAVLLYVRGFRTPVESPDAKRLIAVALLIVFGIMAKQSGVFIGAIIGLHLFVSRNWRGFGIYVSATVLFSELGLLWLFSIASPQIIAANTITGIASGTSSRMFSVLFDPATYKYYIGWHAAGVVLMIHYVRGRDSMSRFLGIAIGVSLLAGFVGLLKRGSDLNYLFEMQLFMVLGIVHWLCGRAIRTKWLHWAFIGYALLFLFYRTRLLQDRTGTNEQQALQAEAFHKDERLKEVIQKDFALRPTDHVYITYRGHLEHLLAGQVVLMQKDIMEWNTVYPFDTRAFDRAMNDGSVRFVISDRPMDTLHLFGRAYPEYRTLREVDSRWILSRTGR